MGGAVYVSSNWELAIGWRMKVPHLNLDLTRPAWLCLLPDSQGDCGVYCREQKKSVFDSEKAKLATVYIVKML